MIISQIVETRRSEARISPSWVATEAMTAMDGVAVQRSHPLIYKAAHLELRQLAREVCRDKWMPPEDRDKDPHPLFPDLQWRYPIARSSGDDPEYVLLDLLADEDVTFNVERLRADAESRKRHADALEAWARDRPRAA